MITILSNYTDKLIILGHFWKMYHPFPSAVLFIIKTNHNEFRTISCL